MLNDLFSFLNLSSFEDESTFEKHESGINNENLFYDNIPDIDVINEDQGIENILINENQSVDNIVISGSPNKDGQYWEWQGQDNSCAIMAQKGILESLDCDVPKDDLVNMSYNNGWYDPKSGTSIEDVGNILENYNIPVERGYDKSLIDIYNALEKGEKVIVVLDANEIWSPEKDYYGNPIEQNDSGHAVWVTGIDMNKEGNLSVILNDSGTLRGMKESVRLEDFKNAWDDFGNFSVITDSQQKEIENMKIGGYENADGTYHYTSYNVDGNP